MLKLLFAALFWGVLTIGTAHAETPTLHDFHDGNGAVAAHQHTNPDGTVGGWVADSASVASTAYVGPNAWVFGNAEVFGNAWVRGNARIATGAVFSGLHE